MLSYISAKEAAERWNISQRRVLVLCGENRISGAMLVGNMWIIPSTAKKPIDKRKALDAADLPSEKFEITIEEEVSKTFLVEAQNKEAAMRIAIDKYENGEYVLDPGNLISKRIAIHDIQNDTHTEWVEF